MLAIYQPCNLDSFLNHSLCALEQIRSKQSSCIPMGIKNAQKIQGVQKKANYME